MGKGTAPLELILAFNDSRTPRECIALGYKESTVYKYSAQFKEVKRIYKEKFHKAVV
jgi:hypothetical protein